MAGVLAKAVAAAVNTKGSLYVLVMLLLCSIQKALPLFGNFQ